MKYLSLSRSYVVLPHIMLALMHMVLLNNLYAHESVCQSDDVLYVCFDKKLSNGALLVNVLSALDSDKNSPVQELKKHLDSGHHVALRTEVLEVLDYADWFINQYEEREIKYLLAPQLKKIIKRVVHGELNVNERDVMRSSDMRLLVHSKARFKQNVRMDKNLSVDGKTYCDGDVECKHDVKIKKNMIVKGSLTVENGISVVDNVFGDVTVTNLSVVDVLTSNSNSVFDQTVTGTLSATQVAVACDVTVGCNVNMTNSTDPAHGNIYKESLSFIHNFGEADTFVGIDAGNFTTTGNNNTGIGFGSLSRTAAGVSNVAVGSSSLSANTQGNRNVALGSLALGRNTMGNDNIALGYSALLANAIGSDNVAVGSLALSTNIQGGQNVAMGTNALRVSSVGANNTALGYHALEMDGAGGANTAIGALALALSQQSNNNNVAVGSSAGAVITHGSNNTFVGQAAGINLTSGDFNIYIGQGVGGGSNESQAIRIGNSQQSAFIAGIFGESIAGATHPVFINSNGQLGMTASSKRFKHNIADISNESAFIYDLNPVTFVYNQDETKTTQYGLIAEEVEQVFPHLVIHEKDGKPLSVRYEVLPVLLLNEMQKQQHVIEDLKSNVEDFSIACNNLTQLVKNFIAGS